jgi:glycine/D-amino acid oxidase-like deaminating enzyme
MRIVVVGGGIFGQVVGWRLALRGARVVVLEPTAAGAGGSGSGDRSRVVRAMYGEQRFAASGARSLGLFREWSAQLGVQLVAEAGVLYLDRDDDDPRHREHAAALDHGMTLLAELGEPFEVLTPGAVAARWPAIDTRSLRRAVLEPRAGFAWAARTTRAIARASVAAGAEHVRGRALAIETARGVASAVVADLGAGSPSRLEADAVVVAAGLAGVELVSPFVDVPLDVRRIPHCTTYWDVPEPRAAALALGALPVWTELGAGMYGFPDDGESGFKVARHEPRWEEAGGSGPPEDFDALRRAAAERFPAMREATLRSVYRCAYDATADEGFLIGETGARGVWLVGGLSGHGFKHGPALGESVAAAVQGGEPLVDLAPFALPRPTLISGHIA